jgi:hypothetical protein
MPALVLDVLVVLELVACEADEELVAGRKLAKTTPNITRSDTMVIETHVMNQPLPRERRCDLAL